MRTPSNPSGRKAPIDCRAGGRRASWPTRRKRRFWSSRALQLGLNKKKKKTTTKQRFFLRCCFGLPKFLGGFLRWCFKNVLMFFSRVSYFCVLCNSVETGVLLMRVVSFFWGCEIFEFGFSLYIYIYLSFKFSHISCLFLGFLRVFSPPPKRRTETPTPPLLNRLQVCSTMGGRPTTLKRSGSDYSATIFAKMLDAANVPSREAAGRWMLVKSRRVKVFLVFFFQGFS